MNRPTDFPLLVLGGLGTSKPTLLPCGKKVIADPIRGSQILQLHQLCIHTNNNQPCRCPRLMCRLDSF